MNNKNFEIRDYAAKSKYDEIYCLILALWWPAMPIAN